VLILGCFIFFILYFLIVVTIEGRKITSAVRFPKSTVKGSGRGGQHQQQQPGLGEEGDFAAHASVYGKVQAEPNVNPNDQRRKGERCLFLPGLGCLATYIDYVPYVSLSRLFQSLS